MASDFRSAVNRVRCVPRDLFLLYEGIHRAANIIHTDEVCRHWNQKVLIAPSRLETLGKKSITPSNHEASALVENCGSVICHPNLVPNVMRQLPLDDLSGEPKNLLPCCHRNCSNAMGIENTLVSRKQKCLLGGVRPVPSHESE